MNPTLDLQEMTIVLVTESQSPAIINQEFLIYSGVVPREWELARQPIYTPQVVQLTFQNGLSITAQPGRIMITEVLGDQPMSESQMAGVARRFVQSLPNLQYEAMGFNPLGHANVGDGTEAVQQYFNQTLLAAGPWQSIGNQPVKSRISFTYTFDESQLNLTVSEAGIRNDDETVLPIVLFSGNFSYTLTSSIPTERIEQLCGQIDRWQAETERFQSIVNETFLASTAPVPALLPVFA